MKREIPLIRIPLKNFIDPFNWDLSQGLSRSKLAFSAGFGSNKRLAEALAFCYNKLEKYIGQFATILSINKTTGKYWDTAGVGSDTNPQLKCK
jgi:hypothetical protein